MAKVGVGGDAQRTTQNSATSMDPVTARYVQGIQNSGFNAGLDGPGPLLTGAADYNSGLMKAGNLGFGALSGDPHAVASLMNPYTSGVIDANNTQWQRINQQAVNQVNDEATKANAFGGSRHGVAEGVALSNNNLAQAGQNAGLLNQGFSDMISRAMGLAGLGFNAAGANAGLGFGGVGSPNLWQMLMMKQGYVGPTGQTSSSATSSVGGKAGASFGIG